MWLQNQETRHFNETVNLVEHISVLKSSLKVANEEVKWLKDRVESLGQTCTRLKKERNESRNESTHHLSLVVHRTL